MKISDVVIFKVGPDYDLHEIVKIEGKAVSIKQVKTGQLRIVGISILGLAGEHEKKQGFRHINPSNFIAAEHAHYWNAPAGYWAAKYAEIS